MKRGRRFGLLGAAAALLLVVPVPHALAAKTTTTTTAPVARTPIDEPIGSNTIVNSWAVAPAGQSTQPSQPSNRPYLTYSVVPGQVINDAVVLYNYSNVPLNFRLYPSDAFNNAEGNFDVIPGSQKPKDVGIWVSVAQEQLDLPPKQEVRVPIVVHIPANASPGDHTGAIMASSPVLGTGPNGKFVNIDRRTGTRVYIRVAGPLHPNLSITRVGHTYHGSLNPFSGHSSVTYRITNEGNVRMAGKQRVSSSALFGWGNKGTRYRDIPELLPGQSVTLKASFKGLPATFIDFATAKLDPNDVEGKVLPVVHRRAATVAIPWTIAALALIYYLLRYAQRAYKRRTEEA